MKMRYYKLLFVPLLATTLGLLILPLPVSASSLIFSKNVITVKTGNIFSLPVSINPSGEKNYTTRLELTFPPDVLELTSFTFAKNWVALSQAGYDLIDNKAGEVIETAGYPVGFSQTVPFGTLTFRTKTTGQAIITVGLKSFSLNAQNKSTLESRPRIVVSVTSPTQPQVSPPVKPLENIPVIEPPALFDIEAGPAPQAPPTALSTKNRIPFAIAGAGLILILAIIFILRKRHLKKNSVDNI